MRRVSALIVALGLLVAGCGSDDDAATTPDESPAATATPDTDQPDQSEPETDPDPTEAPAPTEPPVPDVLELPGVGAIVIEDVNGSGQPELTWPAVDGASWYQLVVLDSAASPYWAWGGPDTAVMFGGGNGGDPGQTAVVFEPMTWSVAAFDDAGTLIGLSEPAALTP